MRLMRAHKQAQRFGFIPVLDEFLHEARCVPFIEYIKPVILHIRFAMRHFTEGSRQIAELA